MYFWLELTDADYLDRYVTKSLLRSGPSSQAYVLEKNCSELADDIFEIFCTGLAVRYMSCDVRPICPVVKERVSLVSGVYTGDAFELGVFI